MPSLTLRSRTSNPHGGGADVLTASDIDRYDQLADDFSTFFEERPDAGMDDFVIGRHLRFLGSGEARVVFRDKRHPKRVVKLNWDDPDQTLKEIQVWNEAPAWIRPHLVPVLGYDRGGRWAVYEYAEPMPADTARVEWAGVDNEVARRLANCGLGDAVAQNLSKDGRLLDYGWFDPVLWGRCAQRRNPAASSAPSSAAFQRWFGASEVVDEQGQPLVVYHGTTAGGFDAFRPNYRKGEQLGFGIHFAQDRGFAAKYAEDPTVARKGKTPKVYAVYLFIQRPLVADAIVYEGTPEFALAKKLARSKLMTLRGEDGVFMAYMQNAIDKTPALRAEKLIREAGYDGILYESVLSTAAWTGTGVGRKRTGSSRSYIVFEPTQVKSATDNAGTFDPADLSIYRNPARRNPAEPRYTLLGVDEEVTVCEHCGKADLKCTVVLGVLDADGNVEREARFGRSCAAKALRKPSTTTANKMESLARVAEFKRVWAMRVDGPGKREQVAAGRFPTYVTSYLLTDGRMLLLQESDPSFRPPAGAWTRLREGAWVGHPSKTNPSRSRARR